MLKTQRFSSLFRHYAKYHGLRKDELEYYFVNPLENEDTPESVQLQRGDTIIVRKRRKPEPPEPAADDSEFFKDMKDLLEEEEHMDAVFIVREEKKDVKIEGKSKKGRKKKSSGGEEETNTTEIRVKAHKCILTARTEFFKNMFNKTTSFREATTSTVTVEPCFSETTIRRMLEFIYCNRIENLDCVEADEILSLLHLADKWQLRDMKRLCEHELIRSHLNIENVAKMYCAAAEYYGKRLHDACISFIMENIKEVAGNTSFLDEMRNYPDLCIPVLQAAAELVPEPVHKKQRTEGLGASTAVGGSTGCSSSPVPDSDS